MRIEVAYAKPEEQLILEVEIGEGTTVEEAITASGILQRFPEIDLNVNKVGIFGKVCTTDRILKEGDRVEIYRPLLVDPKEMRRQRAEKH